MTKKNESVVVPEQMQSLIEEINTLVKVRSALNFGTRTGIRDKAESLMSRRINNRVMTLSEHIMKIFGDEDK
jgi:hypothetical protein